jgi:hypothetical protein
MWSDTAKRPRLFFVDARVAAIFMVFFIHMNLYTFLFSMSGALFLSVLPFFGIDLTNAWRQVVEWISGRVFMAGDPEWVYLRRMRAGRYVRLPGGKGVKASDSPSQPSPDNRVS